MAAAAAASIDSLFRPSTQFGSRDENRHFPKVDILPHLTTDAILAAGIRWDDFRRFLSNKVVTMPLGVSIYSTSNRPVGANLILSLGDRDDSGGLDVVVRWGMATEAEMTACNFLVLLLAASEKRDVYLHQGSRYKALPDFWSHLVSLIYT